MERYDSNFDHIGDFVERWNAGVRRTRVWTIAIGVLLVIALASTLRSRALFRSR